MSEAELRSTLATLASLPDTLSSPLKVPLTAVAFFHGRSFRSNEVLVGLGQQLYSWRSAKQARQLLERRLANLRAPAPASDAPSPMPLPTVDIQEEYDAQGKLVDAKATPLDPALGRLEGPAELARALQELERRMKGDEREKADAAEVLDRPKESGATAAKAKASPQTAKPGTRSKKKSQWRKGFLNAESQKKSRRDSKREAQEEKKQGHGNRGRSDHVEQQGSEEEKATRPAAPADASSEKSGEQPEAFSARIVERPHGSQRRDAAKQEAGASKASTSKAPARPSRFKQNRERKREQRMMSAQQTKPKSTP
eukprot:scaffold2945_cov244-Pinguiococcus_pyrenoidosus.AAC.12